MSEKQNPKISLIEAEEIKTDLRKKEPPLVSLQVSNPVTYLKSWWARVMGGEGVDLHFRIKPLTAIALTIVVASFGFGVGRVTISTQKPYINYVANEIPVQNDTSIPPEWRQTAFSGQLKYTKAEDRYYLLTTSSEAIILEVPENVDLNNLVERRVFATGKYNETKRTLVVSDAADMEVLPKKIEGVPVIDETPQPTVTPELEHIPIPE